MPIREAWEDRDREKSRRRDRLSKKAAVGRKRSNRPAAPAPEIEDFDEDFESLHDENDNSTFWPKESWCEKAPLDDYFPEE